MSTDVIGDGLEPPQTPPKGVVLPLDDPIVVGVVDESVVLPLHHKTKLIQTFFFYNTPIISTISI